MKIDVHFDEYEIRKFFAERFDVEIDNIVIHTVWEDGICKPEVVLTADHFIEDRGY